MRERKVEGMPALTYKGWIRRDEVDRLRQIAAVVVAVVVPLTMSQPLDRMNLSEIQREQS